MTGHQSDKDDQEVYPKIGGWLILFAIGLILYPVQTSVSLGTELFPAVFSEKWPSLTSPESAAYHPLWAPLLIAELVGNLCFLILSIFVIVSFFQQRTYVPQLVSWFLAANFLFVGLDFFLTQRFLFNAAAFEMQPTINLVRTLVASIIWIPYFRLSKRVKKTFVH